MMFSDKIIDWYLIHKRDLPWRKTKNPYYIWLSEIILQQTRVIQGLSYYNAFIQRYPTVIDLADASEEDVLKTWQGLGYYSRARNLHATALSIKEKYNGVFPDTYDDVIKLKGIGKYTAAAILSFAFKKPYPVVDGNVYRFISRLKGIFTPIATEKAYSEFYSLLEKQIDSNRPDLFNHAIMEFGAIVCKPQNPLCEDCIFSSECYAFKHEKMTELPMKNKSKQVRHRYFYYLVIKTNKSRTLLKKRVGNDIWKNLYEFPCIESEQCFENDQLEEQLQHTLAVYGVQNYVVKNIHREIKHQLSHQTIHAFFVEIETDDSLKTTENHVDISINEIEKYPVSVLIAKYLEK